MNRSSDMKPDKNDAHIQNILQSNIYDEKVIRVGSRKSQLALVQTNHVISMLKNVYPDQKFEIYEMTTIGDRLLNISLPKIGEKSLFTKDLEEALKNGEVDFVVHSLKDLPTALPENMAIGAVLEREDPRDALVLAKHHEGKSLDNLPEGSIIGTSSLRRTAQILRLYPNLKVHDIRGNLNTRLAKLDAIDSKYAGIILAQAGLVRLGWQKRVNQTIDPNKMLYAVGQGALAVECRASDRNILKMLQSLVCHKTQCTILAERSFLKTLGGGCSAPVAVHTTLKKTKENEYELSIVGSVWSLDGKIEKQSQMTCKLEMSEKIDLSVKRQLEGEEDTAPLKKMRTLKPDGMKKDQKSPLKIPDDLQTIFESDDITKQNFHINEAGITNTQSDLHENSPSSSILFTQKTEGMETKQSFPGRPSSKCPLRFSIGQEVMGQCPYSNEITLVEMKNNIGCPYKNEANPSKSGIAESMIETCSKIDANATIKNKIENFGDANAVELLFCGIYPHRCWPIKVFEQCEQLGKNLANKLIENGAMSVMECAQNAIRKNI